jgi:hypothetical protein
MPSARDECRADLSDSGILVLVAHPFGDSWVPLEEWMRIGPGPRPLVQPVAAKRASTGEAIALATAVPLAYRNDEESRRLIAAGALEDPWAHLRAGWAAARGSHGA